MSSSRRSSRSVAIKKRSSLNRHLKIEELESRQLLAITVDTNIDELDGSIVDGDVSLRDAILQASSGETIYFDSSLDGLTIELDDTLGELHIQQDLTIDAYSLGSGITVSATDGLNDLPGDFDGYRVFNIDNLDSGTLISVTLRGSIGVTGGDVDGVGGGIRSTENLTIEDNGDGSNYDGGAIFANFSNGPGGGIYSDFGTLTLDNTHVYDNNNNDSFNESNYDGGGIFLNDYSGGAIFTNVSIYNNEAGEHGGGIALGTNVSAQVIDSTINGNTALYGGGISLGFGNLTLQNSTVTGNTANEDGGGIYSATSGTSWGVLESHNSTIAGNTAAYFGSGKGGGIHAGYAPSGYATTSPFFDIKNTIISGNSDDGSNPDLYLGTPTVGFNYLSIGYSLIGDNTGTLLFESPTADPSGNLIGGSNFGPIDPLLGDLQDNGGLTWTRELDPNSPAVDAGDPSAVAGSGNTPLYDQRGITFDRVQGAAIDMGAYEVSGLASADFDSDGDVDGVDFLAWQRGFGIPAPNATKSDGDADNDFDVDLLDLQKWQLEYGSVAPPQTGLSASSQASGLPSSQSDLLGAAIILELAGEAEATEEPTGEDLLFVAETVIDNAVATIDVAVAAPISLGDISETGAPEAAATGEPWLSDELLEQVFG